MRVIKNLSFLLLLLLLTSCSLFRSSEENARQLAIDTAVAYFTFNYEDPEGWMKPVQDEFYYKEFIKNRILPVLAPYLKKYFIKSTASLVSIEELTRGTSSDDSEVILWEIVVQVDPPWPTGDLPEFDRAIGDELPWTSGEITTVYAVAASRLGVWNLKLLSEDSAQAVRDDLVSLE